MASSEFIRSDSSLVPNASPSIVRYPTFIYPPYFRREYLYCRLRVPTIPLLVDDTEPSIIINTNKSAYRNEGTTV